MKNIYYIFLGFTFMLFLAFPIHTKAAEFPLITSGYTENGIYYEVYGEYTTAYNTTTPVTRYVTYQGHVIPPDQIPWQENTNGIKYSGTLQLLSYTYLKKDNITMATYQGKLNYSPVQ